MDCNEMIPATRQPPLLLGDVWHHYISEHCRKKGQDVARVVYTARHWLRIKGADAEVATWKRRDNDGYAERRAAEGVMAATIRREMCLQQAALNHERKYERLEKVPHFEKPSGETRQRRPLTDEEFRRLMASPLPRRVRLMFLMCFWTGHRSRAIETLPWARVNLETRVIDFNEPGARRTNKRRVDGFPIPDELMVRLVAAKVYADKFRPNDPYVIGLGPRGKNSTSYHACKDALRAIGIDETGICRHALRKTFVTERIKAGFSRSEVAALIADNPATMDRHYAILQTNDLREAANMRRAA